MFTVTDQFCGAGGSSVGATAVEGIELVMALNHDELAISTHGTNFPNAQHALVDVACSDPRWFPHTEILITSPECKAHSYARGRPKDDPFVFDPKGDFTAERSRATMWDVPRFTEVHNYELVIVENVVQAVEWGPKNDKGSQFRAWLMAMTGLGYEHRIVSFNSMFAPPTPQSRDRMYVVFWKKGMTPPDLDFLIDAWCPHCERIVEARQYFKRPNKYIGENVGRYGSQYHYVCDSCSTRALPLVTPAAAAVDWSLEAPRIGDRKKPLAEATMARIQRGLNMIGEPAMIVQTGAHTYERDGALGRIWGANEPYKTITGTLDRGVIVNLRQNAVPKHADAGPLPTVCTDPSMYVLDPPAWLVGKRTDARTRPVTEPAPAVTSIPQIYLLVAPRQGLVVPLHHLPDPGKEDTVNARHTDRPMPTQTGRQELGIAMIDTARRNSNMAPTTDPLQTVTAEGNHHALVIANYGPGFGRSKTDHPGGWARDADREPIGTITERDSHAIVLSYHRGNTARNISEPLGTATTVDPYALVRGSNIQVEDCGFRMLEPHEIARAMVMDTHNDGSHYTVHGTKRDKVKQYGNAVTPPVMKRLVAAGVKALAA